MNRFGIILLYFTIALALSGGFIFEGTGYRFEISQLNVFGIILLLVFLATRSFTTKSVSGDLEKRTLNLIGWGMNNPDKKLKWAVGLSATVALTGQLLRHYTFETTFFDMTCVNPPLFFPFEPRFFHCSVCRNGTQFAEHILWSLVPFSLIFQFFKSDVLIMIFKAVCIFVPTYFFIKKGPLRERPSFGFWAFALLMLSLPFKANFSWDFREDHLAFGFVLLSLLMLYQGRAFWAFVMIVLIAFTKENLPISTLFYFVPILWAKEIPFSKKRRFLLAGSVVVFSLIYTILVFKVFIPHFMEGSESRNNILLRFPGMGNTMEEFFSNMIHHPIQFIFAFLSRLSLADTVKYLSFLLLPFLMGYRAWIWTAPAWPQIAANILVDHPIQRMMIHHYDIVIIAFLFAALCFAMAKQEFKESRLVWGLLIALTVAGRGPLIEVTRRLFYKGHLIPAALEMNKWNNIESPLAADAFTVTHFHRVPHLRILEIHQKTLPESREDRLRTFVEMNPIRSIYDQAPDAKDAKTYLINLRHIGGPFVAEELRTQGAEEVATAKDLYGTPMAILFKVKRSPFEVICERDGFCQKPFAR